MAKLKVVNSGSSGNAYILECDNETLLIELGVSFQEIIDKLYYNIPKVSGAIVSHKHLDHANKRTIEISDMYFLTISLTVFSTLFASCAYPATMAKLNSFRPKIVSHFHTIGEHSSNNDLSL